MRGRVGFTATDRVLLYVTGGFAALNLEFTQTFSEPPFVASVWNAADGFVLQD